MHKKEEHLEEEEIRKQIYVEFTLEIRYGCFDESEVIEKEVEYDEREEKLKCETEHLLHHMHE